MSAPFGKSKKYLAGTVWQDTFNKTNDNNIKIFFFIIELLLLKQKNPTSILPVCKGRGIMMYDAGSKMQDAG
jgi:hypothetical protein